MKLLGGLDSQTFLHRHWQKKPLLVRQALPDLRDPYSPEELAALACGEQVESRLVQELGEQNWQLRHGPFNEQDFLALPASHWTVLIQDAEKHAPVLAELLEPFRFIPDWRVDDLMVSYAAAEGSVGPHSDSYDVFLLQGQGRRLWRIDTRLRGEQPLLDSPLRILRDFDPEQEWILESGDMLYLPPGIAHHGIALEPCITYSIGFRAPAYRDLVAAYVDDLLQDIDPELLYSDPDLPLQAHPGELTPQLFGRIAQCLRQQLNVSDAALESWFGRYITESKAPFSAEALHQPFGFAELRAELAQGSVLERNPGSRFLFVDHARGESALFVDGLEIILSPESAFLAHLLCRWRSFDQTLLAPVLRQSEARAVLLELVNAGYLVFYEDDD